MLNLKQLRREKKMSQSDVASILGITQQAYANYERGARQADYSSLKKLSEYFNVSIDYLLGNDQKNNLTTNESDEADDVLQDPITIKILNTINKLNPEYRKIALAQLEALANPPQSEDK